MFETEIATMQPGWDAHNAGPVHVPVLGATVVELFRPAAERDPHGWVVDGTLGLGGHTRILLEAFPGIRVLGVDQDPQAIVIARERLSQFNGRLRIRHGRMSGLSRLIRKEQIEPPVGVLLDVGVSSMQLDVGERGFSFQVDGPLDMRMDSTRDRTAADIVNHWDESDLADLFFHEGGEHRSRRVARAIVEGRRRAPFLRTLALADIVARAVGEDASSGRIHPATKTFQALRRAVNEEGEELLAGLAAAMHWLADGGRLVAITFHSGEDGEVKRFLADAGRQGTSKLLTKRPVVADREERQSNPRARSAHLRAAERTRTGSAPGSPASPSANGDSVDLDRGPA